MGVPLRTLSPWISIAQATASSNRGLRRPDDEAGVIDAIMVVVTPQPSPDIENLLRRTYAAFNARDVDAALANAHVDVDWPNVIEGIRIHGHDEVRAYWARQFETTE